MAAYPTDHPAEAPASAAQLRDLSAQVQALQARLVVPQRLEAEQRRPRGALLYPGLIVVLACALAASLLRPERVAIRTVHDLRTVTVVHVVHDVRVVVATPVPAPRPPAAGVSVCADSGFDQAVALCRRPVAALAMGELAGARVSYSGKDGGTFTDTQVTIVVAEQGAGGSVSPIGRLQVGVLLTGTRQVSRLAGVFDAVGARARPGSTYLIEVDQGSTNLGATRFTIAA